MKSLLTPLCIFISIQAMFSQGSVGVGTATPNSSAILDVSSTTKGMLMPRMTTAQRDAIVSPTIGLQVLNLDDMCTDIYDGTYWIKNCGLKLIGHDTAASIWIQKASFPQLLDFAVGFSIGNKGYIGTGFTTVESRQFWEYDPVNNAWTQKADFGGTARSGAAGFSINNKGYIGTGYLFFSALRDFWEYDPTNNAWIQKADFGGPEIYAAVGFSIGGKGYIGSGRNQNFDYSNEFWEYNPANDTWVQKTNYPGEGTEGAVGFSIGSKGYLGTGNSSNEFWEFNPINNAWIQRANFEGEPRIEAVGFSLNGLGYIGTGQAGPTIVGDFWSYNPATNLWTQEANYGGEARVGAVGFAIGNIGYLGLGVDDLSLSDFWAYNLFPVAPIYEHTFDADNVARFDDGIWTREMENIFLSGSGNVGIGINNPSQKLVVNGNGVFTGTVTASCGVLACSDMRYKINVLPIEHALKNITLLQGITYDWDKEKFPEKEFNDRHQIGISAQELEKVYPEMVFTDSDGYKTVDYSRLTPVLIEGMKEQQRQIEELQQQVRKLIEMVSSD